jgi:hypothetical protein
VLRHFVSPLLSLIEYFIDIRLKEMRYITFERISWPQPTSATPNA